MSIEWINYGSKVEDKLSGLYTIDLILRGMYSTRVFFQMPIVSPSTKKTNKCIYNIYIYRYIYINCK